MSFERFLDESIKNDYKDEIRRAVADADRMLEGWYIYDSDWDMERCLHPVENRQIRWDVQFNKDPEWTYMFCRMDYLWKLIAAYSVTGDGKYLGKTTKKPSLEYLYSFEGTISPEMPGCDRQEVSADHGKNEKETSVFLRFVHQTLYRADRDGIFLFCSNAPRNPGGHKHYDYLSFLYYYHGYSVFADRGRYTYKDGEERKFFVGPEAHNTVRVDGDRYYEYLRPWSVRQRIGGCAIESFEKEGSHTTKMSLTFGYGEAAINRTVTLTPENVLKISDEIISAEGVRYEAFFNLAEDIRIEGDLLHLPDGTALRFECISDHDIIKTVDTADFSRRYNEKSVSPRICFGGDDISGTVSYVLKENPILTKV